MGLTRQSSMVVRTLARLFGRGLEEKQPSATLGILAFDAAKIMSRLVSLYRSLADDEILNLRNETIKSKGIKYLNSKDEGFLLDLACSERLQELDITAASVSRFGKKCSDFCLNRFDLVYVDLKLGIIEMRKLDYGTRSTDKIVEKMEKLIAATSNLYHAMESLNELQGLEMKAQHYLKQNPRQKESMSLSTTAPNIDILKEKISNQEEQVQYYKNVSLWNQTYDKAVGTMTRIVCIIYARIHSIFGSCILGSVSYPANKQQPSIRRNFKRSISIFRQRSLSVDYKERLQERGSKSGPLPKTQSGLNRVMSGFSRALVMADMQTIGKGGGGEMGKSNKLLSLASSSTVGGAGLSLKYANVIIFAERCLQSQATTVGEDARGLLYEMLPGSLRKTITKELRRRRNEKEDDLEEGEEGFKVDNHPSRKGRQRQALKHIIDWLSPMAHDTVKWYSERSMEKQRFETKPTVMSLQTLHYSDLQKTEAAIVELLVGLSYIYERRRRSNINVTKGKDD